MYNQAENVNCNNSTLGKVIPFFIPNKPKIFFYSFEGKVKVAHVSKNSNYSDTCNSIPDKNIFFEAERYIKLWPSVYKELPKYVKFINPIECYLLPDNAFASSSGTSISEFGVIHSTARHSFPLAEALVHEMAHLKLFTFGINYESSEAIITNNPEERYYSPVRETERPMTAIFHAQYSFIHVLYLNNLILKHDTENKDYDIFLSMAQDTLTRMKEGYEVIKTNIKTDSKGEGFVYSFLNWAKETITETELILGRHGITG